MPHYVWKIYSCAFAWYIRRSCCVECSVSNPQTWTEQADDLIKRSMKSRSSSKDYRDNICQLLADCSTSLFRQWNIVNAAFTDRIRDYIDAKHKLEINLSKVGDENWYYFTNDAHQDVLVVLLLCDAHQDVLVVLLLCDCQWHIEATCGGFLF
jgi:Tektin family